MQTHVKTWNVREMARTLGVSASGYYRYCQGKLSFRAKENNDLLIDISNIFMKSRKTYGSPRIHAELASQGRQCSRPRVARLMKKGGLRAKMRRSFKRGLPLSTNVRAQGLIC